LPNPHAYYLGTILRQISVYQKHPRMENKQKYVNWQKVKYVQTLGTASFGIEELEKLLPVTRRKR